MGKLDGSQLEIHSLVFPVEHAFEACISQVQLLCALAPEVNRIRTSAAKAVRLEIILNCTPEGALHPTSPISDSKLTYYPD